MDHTLATQLWDNGLPHETYIYHGQVCDKLPNLSELITACNCKDFNLSLFGGRWMAASKDKKRALMGIADTPEGAVAELWFQLQQLALEQPNV